MILSASNTMRVTKVLGTLPYLQRFLFENLQFRRHEFRSKIQDALSCNISNQVKSETPNPKELHYFSQDTLQDNGSIEKGIRSEKGTRSGADSSSDSTKRRTVEEVRKPS